MSACPICTMPRHCAVFGCRVLTAPQFLAGTTPAALAAEAGLTGRRPAAPEPEPEPSQEAAPMPDTVNALDLDPELVKLIGELMPPDTDAPPPVAPVAPATAPQGIAPSAELRIRQAGNGFILVPLGEDGRPAGREFVALDEGGLAAVARQWAAATQGQ